MSNKAEEPKKETKTSFFTCCGGNDDQKQLFVPVEEKPIIFEQVGTKEVLYAQRPRSVPHRTTIHTSVKPKVFFSYLDTEAFTTLRSRIKDAQTSSVIRAGTPPKPIRCFVEGVDAPKAVRSFGGAFETPKPNSIFTHSRTKNSTLVQQTNCVKVAEQKPYLDVDPKKSNSKNAVFIKQETNCIKKAEEKPYLDVDPKQSNSKNAVFIKQETNCIKKAEEKPYLQVNKTTIKKQ